MSAAREVPVGSYALDFLEKASVSSQFAPGYGAAVLANVVSYEENVRAVLSKVALGEADAGIVYSSDVTPDVSSQVLASPPIPSELNTLAAYPIAPITGTRPILSGAAFPRRLFCHPKGGAGCTPRLYPARMKWIDPGYTLTSPPVSFPHLKQMWRRSRHTAILLLLSAPLLLFFTAQLLGVDKQPPRRLICGPTVQDPAVAQAVWLSVTTSTTTLLLALTFGMPVAYLFTRSFAAGQSSTR